jgi:hypothetical protein
MTGTFLAQIVTRHVPNINLSANLLFVNVHPGPDANGFRAKTDFLMEPSFE